MSFADILRTLLTLILVAAALLFLAVLVSACATRPEPVRVAPTAPVVVCDDAGRCEVEWREI